MTELETKEVSGVKRPAIGETFLIVKSEDHKMPEQVPVAAAASDGEGAPGASDVEPQSVKIVMASATKEALLAAAKAGQERLAAIEAILNNVAIDDGVAGAPDEIVITFADVANMIASTVSPFVMRDGAVGAEELEKSKSQQEGQDAVAKGMLAWSPEYIDSLPDWCFAYVETSSSHDNDWRTIPLSNRHFPIRDHAGRLSLPGVVDAIEQIAAVTPPFMSESKKRWLLLSLASERLYETMIVVRREANVPPETAAELAAIAEQINSVTQLIAGPKPLAEGQAAPVADQAAPSPDQVQQSFREITQKAVAAVKAIYVKKSDGDVTENEGETPKDDLAKAADGIRAACETMKSALAMMEGSLPGGQASAEPVAKSVNGASDATAKQIADLTEQVKSLTVTVAKGQQDLGAARQRIAKMERQAPISNVVPEERVDTIAKGNPHESAAPPAISDFNALSADARATITKNAGGSQRAADLNTLPAPARSGAVGPIADFNAT
ncbi:hypothetical protein EKK58_05660 [Candidatus Dependentiae bacterium]|nr:MAG: hypothetical protein EKK58_05660 [Candidatus Dependentiae bacterium]